MASLNVSKWTQGVGTMDALAAAGGLIATTIVPGRLVKDSSTTSGKALKLGAAFLAAVAAGMLFNKVGGERAGKAAVIGGLAGLSVQALSAFTSIKLAGPGGPVAALPVGRQIGTATTVSPAFTREGETVSLIRP